MKVLFVGPLNYDYLAATVIVGFRQLAAGRRLSLIVRHRANYARRGQVWPDAKILKERRRFDLFILGSGHIEDIDFFFQVADPRASICIDGADEWRAAIDPTTVRLYFKREMRLDDDRPFLPCPFGIEPRWWQPLNTRPRLLFSALFEPRPGARAETLRRLTEWCLPQTRLGGIPLARLDVLKGILMGQCTLSTWRHRYRFAVGHNRRCYRALHDSLASLSVSGSGQDTGRWWEILGSGALLVSPRLDLRMPSPFVPGEHFLEYDNIEALRSHLDRLFRSPESALSMRRAARIHAERFHTVAKRAEYILSAIDSNGFRPRRGE